jgi:hypothetical protein
MTMTIGGADVLQGESIEMIVDGRYLYTKAPAVLGGGSGWTRMDMTDVVGFRGAHQFGQDPSQYLAFLHGAGGDVEEVGTEDIDGVTTTHYEAEVTFDAILEHASESGEASEEELEALRSQLEPMEDAAESIPTEVWVDEDGLPRRIKLSMSFETAGESMEMDMTMDLFDYGLDVDVEPPSRYEDLTAPAG